MARSIARKISFAALTLTMAVVVILGAVSYFFSRASIRRHVEERLLVTAGMLSDRIAIRLKHLDEDLGGGMAKNLLVVNALADSEGRSQYLEPYLRSYHPVVEGLVHLTLCDYAGAAAHR